MQGNALFLIAFQKQNGTFFFSALILTGGVVEPKRASMVCSHDFGLYFCMQAAINLRQAGQEVVKHTKMIRLILKNKSDIILKINDS